MQFLNVYCEKRKATVYISLDKIVLVSNSDDACIIELLGTEPVQVNMNIEELMRLINGESKVAIGFRANR